MSSLRAETDAHWYDSLGLPGSYLTSNPIRPLDMTDGMHRRFGFVGLLHGFRTAACTHPRRPSESRTWRKPAVGCWGAGTIKVVAASARTRPEGDGVSRTGILSLGSAICSRERASCMQSFPGSGRTADRYSPCAKSQKRRNRSAEIEKRCML